MSEESPIRVRTYTDPSSGANTTLHTVGKPFETLFVTHSPRGMVGTHSFRIGVDSGGTQLLHNFRWPSGDRGEEAAVYHDGKRLHYLAPPSPELRALIESHHDNHAWMPLLDRIAEEYPEIEPAVQHHTAARAQS